MVDLAYVIPIIARFVLLYQNGIQMQKPSSFERKLLRLIRDYGFDVQGNLLIQKGVRGLSSDITFRTVRGLFDAADQLIPILKDGEYTERFNSLGKEQLPARKKTK